jgi:hypothetical protein
MDVISGLPALALANNTDQPPASTIYMPSDQTMEQLSANQPSQASKAAELTTSCESDAMPKRQREDECNPNMQRTSSSPIIDTLHTFIQQERIRDFNFLGQYSHCYMKQPELLKVTHAESDEIASVHKRAGRDTTAKFHDWYTFTEPLRSNEFTRTVAIEVVGANPTMENMAFTECNRGYKTTHNAATWIRNKFSPAADDMYEMRFGDMQYDEQRMWWSSTGQTFRLLALPGEMREAIYLQILGPIVIPGIIRNPRMKITLGFGQTSEDAARLGRNRDPDIDRPNMTIMRICKQITEEATIVAHNDTTKRFTTLRETSNNTTADPQPPTLAIFSTARALAPTASFLRHIQLELTASRYMSLIGITPTRGKPFAPGSQSFSLAALRRFTGLQTLDFRFISPKHKSAICPWSFGAKHSCQKAWINLFFMLGYDRLKDLSASKSPNVKFSLSGCIKTSSRLYWEEVLNERGALRPPEIKAREQSIRDGNGPVECKCSNLCYEEVGAKKLFDCEEFEIRAIEGLQGELDRVYWDFED